MKANVRTGATYERRWLLLQVPLLCLLAMAGGPATAQDQQEQVCRDSYRATQNNCAAGNATPSDCAQAFDQYKPGKLCGGYGIAEGVAPGVARQGKVADPCEHRICRVDAVSGTTLDNGAIRCALNSRVPHSDRYESIFRFVELDRYAATFAQAARDANTEHYLRGFKELIADAQTRSAAIQRACRISAAAGHAQKRSGDLIARAGPLTRVE